MKLKAKKPTTGAPGGGELGERFEAILATSGLTASRRARPKVMGAGAAVVVAGAVVGAGLFGSGHDTRRVLVAARPIDAGAVIAQADLRSVTVSGQTPFRSTPSASSAGLVGKVAAVPIAAGSLVLMEQLQSQQSAPPGTVLVGVVLDPGALPTPDLRFGDQVQVLATTSANAVVDEPAQVLTTATVWRVWNTTEGSGRRAVTLAVPTALGAPVGDVAARGLVRLLVVPTDTAVSPLWPRAAG